MLQTDPNPRPLSPLSHLLSTTKAGHRFRHPPAGKWYLVARSRDHHEFSGRDPTPVGQPTTSKWLDVPESCELVILGRHGLQQILCAADWGHLHSYYGTKDSDVKFAKLHAMEFGHSTPPPLVEAAAAAPADLLGHSASTKAAPAPTKTQQAHPLFTNPSQPIDLEWMKQVAAKVSRSPLFFSSLSFSLFTHSISNSSSLMSQKRT